MNRETIKIDEVRGEPKRRLMTITIDRSPKAIFLDEDGEPVGWIDGDGKLQRTWNGIESGVVTGDDDPNWALMRIAARDGLEEITLEVEDCDDE